jgi:phage-related baseplate assembly protein
VSSYTAVDLSQLPFPDAVETLDYETILAEMLDDFHTRMTAIEPTFVPLVEGDPAYKVLEVAAYRELVIRQRVNDAIKAVCLAYAAGADLDQIGARFNVERLLIQAGDPDAVPPTDDVYESHADYRRRIQLSPTRTCSMCPCKSTRPRLARSLSLCSRALAAAYLRPACLPT